MIKILNFLLEKFEIVSHLFTKENDKRYIIKAYFGESQPQFDYENLIGIYKVLLKKQSKKYIFDFSEVFNYFVNRLNNLDQLISLKNLYKEELSAINNKFFKENIIKNIHKIGFKEIMNGAKKNIEILKYLSHDDVYCKKDCKIGEFKNFEILKKLKIELMDDKFFEIFNKDKIYSFFEENYEKYLMMFPSIDKVKYFGLFLKLLPPEK